MLFENTVGDVDPAGENSRHFVTSAVLSPQNLLHPIRSTTQIWEVTLCQQGISALVSNTSFCSETTEGVAKFRLFSQTNIDRFMENYKTVSPKIGRGRLQEVRLQDFLLIVSVCQRFAYFFPPSERKETAIQLGRCFPKVLNLFFTELFIELFFTYHTRSLRCPAVAGGMGFMGSLERMQ